VPVLSWLEEKRCNTCDASTRHAAQRRRQRAAGSGQRAGQSPHLRHCEARGRLERRPQAQVRHALPYEQIPLDSIERVLSYERRYGHGRAVRGERSRGYLGTARCKVSGRGGTSNGHGTTSSLLQHWHGHTMCDPMTLVHIEPRLARRPAAGGPHCRGRPLSRLGAAGGRGGSGAPLSSTATTRPC
jgi:hypothetical protein